jgi:hypothetical protein
MSWSGERGAMSELALTPSFSQTVGPPATLPTTNAQPCGDAPAHC